jgi:hypothetical protein
MLTKGSSNATQHQKSIKKYVTLSVCGMTPLFEKHKDEFMVITAT